MDRLRSLPVPDMFSREKAGSYWGLFSQGLLAENASDIFLQEMIKILESPELTQLINNGNITLAAIRPRLEASVRPGAVGGEAIFDDSNLADFLLGQIKPPLQVVCHLSIVTPPELVGEFYAGGPKRSMEKSPAEYPDRYGNRPTNRWGEWLEYMTSGPTTFIILYSCDGNAVSCWRDQMGNHRRVEILRETQPESLRAQFAVDSDKNLFHGSSSPEEVLREIKIISDYLERILPN